MKEERKTCEHSDYLKFLFQGVMLCQFCYNRLTNNNGHLRRLDTYFHYCGVVDKKPCPFQHHIIKDLEMDYLEV